jgi:hypothetical protein
MVLVKTVYAVGTTTRFILDIPALLHVHPEEF